MERSEPMDLSSDVSRQAQWQDWWCKRASEGCETVEVFPLAKHLVKANMVFWKAVIFLKKTLTILFNSTD